jgi:ATP-binding cassette, subfamily B, bacterial
VERNGTQASAGTRCCQRRVEDGVRLIRDLWATSPRRTLAVACVVLLGAAGQAIAAALAGPVLLVRSRMLFAGLAAALLTGVAGDLAVALLVGGLSTRWAAEVRRRLCRAAFGQDLPALEATPVGELLDRIDGDVSEVAEQVRTGGIRLAQLSAKAALCLVTAAVVWWPAAAVMLVLALLLGAGLRGTAGRIGAARVGAEEAWSDLAAVTEEAIYGQDDVRTSLARPYVLRLYARRASRVLSRGRLVWRLSGRVTSTAVGLTRSSIAVVALAGAAALASHHIDGARLTAVWLLAVAYGGTVESVSWRVPDLQNALGAWTRVRLMQAAPQEPAGGTAPAGGDLVLRDLTFSYPAESPRDGRHRPALRGVRLSLRTGRSYALIGRTGSGKSTLAKVLSRTVEVPRGSVFLGGTDLVDLDVEALRRWVAVLPQRTEILAGTLLDNITLFDAALCARACAAVHELGLAGWVEQLPDGMATRLGPGGHVLSAGQEQLVAFARVLVRDPHVVVLDEATARMDPLTEARVQTATRRLLRGRIGVVIAHRLATVAGCDQVVVLADGAVVEAGPLRESAYLARLRPDGGMAPPVPVAGTVLCGPGGNGRTQPPPAPPPPPARILREVLRLTTNDARYGLGALALSLVLVLVGLDGSALPWLWADLVDGRGRLLPPLAGILAALLVAIPLPYLTGRWFPEWALRQRLRIGLRLVHGQTGPRRISAHQPAEVVAQANDADRAVGLADNLIDQLAGAFILVSMTAVSGSTVPALFFGGVVVVSAVAASGFGRLLERCARRTVAARAAFATALVSALSAARTVKLAGATRPVLAHLASLDDARRDRERRETAVAVCARSAPVVLAGLLPVAAWALYLSGALPAGATLVAVATLGAARRIADATVSLISRLPSARVWTRRTVAMCGTGGYSAPVPGVDLAAGTAPAPSAPARRPLRRLDLVRFTAVHENGAVAVRDVDLTIHRGQVVLVVGPVGAGKSSLLRALAGIVHHTGELRWNGEPVTRPELFLRPNQVSYVGQLPRVLSGTVADNVRLGYAVDAASALSAAQLDHDLAGTGDGPELLVGHKGTRLSGGQLQRLALARALAPRTELLIADDVSSALDVATERELWRALRGLGLTVVGATAKRAALEQADHVLVLLAGRAVAQGPWQELAARWGHLAA